MSAVTLQVRKVLIGRASNLQEFCESAAPLLQALVVNGAAFLREPEASWVSSVLSRVAVRLLTPSAAARDPKELLSLLIIPVRARDTATLGDTGLSVAVQEMERAWDTSRAFEHAVALLILEGLLLGEKDAFQRFAGRSSSIGEYDNAATRGLAPNLLGATLNAYGWIPSDRTIQIDVAQEFEKGLLQIEPSRLPRILHKAAYCLALHEPETGIDWPEEILKAASRVVTSQISIAPLACAEAGQVIEHFAYMDMLKRKDTEDVSTKAYNFLEPMLRMAGKALGQILSDKLVPQQKKPALPRKHPRVAFFLLGDAKTAHAQMLITYLRGLVQHETPELEPVIYVISKFGINLDYLEEEMAAIGVQIRQASREEVGSPLDVAVWLFKQSIEDALDAFVYVGITEYMCLTSSTDLAPVRIWWSLKYHNILTAGLDGYLCVSLFGRHPKQLTSHWRVSEVTYPPLYDPDLADEAHRLRDLFGSKNGHVICGCLGRTEKLMSREYIAAVASILRSNPNCIYLFTGTSENTQFRGWLKDEGVSERCHYIGWVDTRLYAQVLDLQIDTFPFASGHTTAQCMAAGTPVVTLLTNESLDTSFAINIVPVYRGEAGTDEEQRFTRELFDDGESSVSLYPFFESVEEYISFANKAIADKEFRERAGDAGRKFVNRFLQDETRMSRSMSRHILEIIKSAEA